MATALVWNNGYVRIGTASTYRSYNSGNPSYLYLDAKATLSGTTASVTVRYSLYVGGDNWSGFGGNNRPYSYAQEGSTTILSEERYSACNQYSYCFQREVTRTYTADSNGNFASPTYTGYWKCSPSGADYPPPDQSVSGQITLPKLGATVGTNYWTGSAWTSLRTLDVYGWDGSQWRLIKWD